MKRLLSLAFLITGFLSLQSHPTALFAQDTSGPRFYGQVLSTESGKSLGGAEVRVEGRTDKVVYSDNSGNWEFTKIPVGQYLVTVTLLGYRTWTRQVELHMVEEQSLAIELTSSPFLLDGLVVTAGRRLQRLQDVVVPTEVITASDIRETGASDLAAVLMERTGIDLQGGHPTGAGVMVQGMGSERVLILLDGQPFIGRISGTVDASRIPVSMIERVEVVKGPQSTLYGSEAMGGVINVISKEPGEKRWNGGTRFGAGGQGRIDTSVNLMGGIGPATAIFEVGNRSMEITPGLSNESGGLTVRWDARGKTSWQTPIENLKMEASAFLLDERQEWKSGQLGYFVDNNQWSGTIKGIFSQVSSMASVTLYSTAFQHLSRKSTGSKPTPAKDQKEIQGLHKIEFLYNRQFKDNPIDMGFELTEESIKSPRIQGEKRGERNLESFAQTTLGWNSFKVVPGMRISSSQIWGQHFTPRLATIYRPGSTLAIRASVGEGFRAPSFKELSMEFLNIGPGFGYTVKGNPELKPEVSRNLTTGFEWSSQKVWSRVQVFDNRFRDFIETSLVGDSTGIQVYSYGNVENGYIRGFEIEMGTSLASWRLEGGWTLLSSKDELTDQELLGRPKKSSRFTLGYGTDQRIAISFTGNRTGPTAMRRTETGTELRPAFLRFDLNALLRISDSLEFNAGIDNLMDEQVENWPNFSRRHFYSLFSWKTDR